MTVSKSPWRIASAGVYLTLLASTCAATARAETELAWKFQKDDTFQYVFNQSNDINLMIQGQSVQNLSQLKLELTWKVMEVKDGVAQITQTVDRAETHIKSGGQSFDYDSADKNPPASPAAQQLSMLYGSVIGEPYTLEINAKGEILKVTVPEKVTKTVENSPFKAMADGGSVLSATGVKNMFSQVLPTLPEGPVEVGKELPARKPLEIPAGPLKMVLTTTSKVTDVKDGSAVVASEIKTDISTNPDATVKLNVKLNDQQGKAGYTFDATKGKLKESTLEQNFDLSLEVMGQTIEQKIALKAVMSLK